MAQGRPLSRHGGYEPFIGTGPIDLGESENNEFYKRQEYSTSRYTSSRPKSGFRKKRSSPSTEYDQYARIPYSEASPRGEPPVRPQSRRGVDGFGNGPQRRQSLDSDDSYTPSPPARPFGSPDDPPHTQPGHMTYRERPASSSSRASRRPPSARVRSSRRHHPDLEPSEHELEGELENIPAIRPPSSFSKYRLLPAIGTPTPAEPNDGPPSGFLFENPHISAQSTNIQDLHHSYDQPQHQPQPPQLVRRSHNSAKQNSRVSSAISDISVISTKASSRSRRSSDEHHISEFIERLDLSQLEKPAAETNRRKKNVSHSSPGLKNKAPTLAEQDLDPGVLYDGDDDDSDTLLSANSRKDSEFSYHLTKAATPLKQPVIIPSPNNPPDREILLAVKLPKDGTRHQRYFKCNETLQAILDFAEDVGRQDFAGYILVSSAPKMVYKDMEETIGAAGLEDKIVLHLEEND